MIQEKMQICPKCSQNNKITARNCIYCGSSLPLIPLLARGTVLNNRYIIMHVLGFGGFGAVYLAFDQRLGNRRVAIKELLQTTPEVVRQFEIEAKILATLSHPVLPKAYDWFKYYSGDIRYYLVMEFIDGISIWDLVQQKGMMTPATAIQVIEPVLDAVAYLHNQNPPIIHRDIKPSNILLTRDRKVYLVDFGIAKIVKSGQRTATGAQGVTPGFSPPEQYLSSGETDVRSDIYSLGATLYFMLTAKIPPDVTERLQREIAGQPSLEPIRNINRTVSPQIEKAIFKAMALRKEHRFNNVNEFLQGLKGQITITTQQTAQSIYSSQSLFSSQSIQSQQILQLPNTKQSSPTPPKYHQFTNVDSGVREWCPICKATFYVSDPSLEWIHCPNCGQLIHRQVARINPTVWLKQINWFTQIFHNPQTLIRIGAIIALISLLFLPLISLVGCESIKVKGLDIIQSQKEVIDLKIILIISIISALLPLFMSNVFSCLISSLIGLVSFIILVFRIKYTYGVGGLIRYTFDYGSFSTIFGFMLIFWASYQKLKRRFNF